jgi:hypothetical protein
MVKVYRKLRPGSLSTTVKHKGGYVEVSFTSSSTAENGTFTTDNEELQRSIESDSGFDKAFCLAPGYEKWPPQQAATPTVPQAATTPTTGSATGKKQPSA